MFEAYLGGRWYLFDATRQAALDGLARIGLGRDASEVAFTTINGTVEAGEMVVHIEPSPPLAQDYKSTTLAVTMSAE